MIIDFSVPGIPVAKGSARAFYVKKKGATIGRAIVVQTNATKQKPWASMISVMAKEKMSGPLYDGAIGITLLFKMPRPKSHFGKHGLKPHYPVDHTKKPDLDKLARTVLDALTGVVWRDDSQVCSMFASKCYDGNPGLNVRIEGE